MCQIPAEVINLEYSYSTRLVSAANDIREKFTNIFALYAKCDKMFNSRNVVDTPLLGKNIDIN